MAAKFVEDFDDGNDAGWTRYDPFADVLGEPSYAKFEFPEGNRLRISSPVSPAPTFLGAARAADVRMDLLQTDFFLTTDLVGWDDQLDQIVGLVARGTKIGLGSTNSYLFAYDPRYFETGDIAGRLEITRLDGEVGSVLTTFQVSLVPNHVYRLAFTGIGAELSGEVFDRTTGMELVATLKTTDATYANGSAGVFVADASIKGDRPADGTFDNFTADASAAKGDINRDGQVNALDVASMMKALADLHGDASMHGITAPYLTQIGDVSGNGQLTNADLQSLIGLLRSGNGASAVPEPGGLAIFFSGAILINTLRRRSYAKISAVESVPMFPAGPRSLGRAGERFRA